MPLEDFNHVKTMTLHTLCGIHAGKGNEQETIMDYKTSKLPQIRNL